jgi:23S rRNA (adenine2503-C2)-methyltransferase
MSQKRKDIRNLSIDELKEVFSELGEPAYRARQMFMWLYKKNVSDVGQMSDLPKQLINELEKRYYIGSLECLETKKATDRTVKLLWSLNDGHFVESVLIPHNRRKTLCLSTQVGCKFGCPFCVSGSRGFVRNLSVSEIVGQVLGVSKALDVKITNIVLMGIGEPLDNFDHVARAIKVMNHPEGLQIGARRITLSTCGLVPEILKLSQLGLQIELSVSLHAANDRLRDQLVPANRKYPLSNLFSAIETYALRTGRKATLEYALIKGVNDSTEAAIELGDAAKYLNAKVNLISCNPNQSPDYKGTSLERLNNFMSIVTSRGAEVTIRHTRGESILAACGQLAIDRKERQPG